MKTRQMLAAIVAGLCFTLSARAASIGPSLQLNYNDFSSWNETALRGPAVEDGDVDGKTWNVITGAGEYSNLKYDDGTSATGVTADLGQASSAGSTIDFGSSNLIEKTNGYVSSGSVYSSDTYKGFWWTTNDTAQIAAQISGLPAGLYEVWVVPNEDTHDSNADASVYIGANLTSSTGQTALVATGVTNSEWDEGEDYVLTTLSLGASDDLVVISDRAGAQSVLNTIQIVPIIPEPASFALVILGGLMACCRRPTRRT